MRHHRLTPRDYAIRGAAFAVEFAVCVALVEVACWGMNRLNADWPDFEREAVAVFSDPKTPASGKMAIPTAFPASLRRPQGSQLATPTRPYVESDHSQEYPEKFFFPREWPLYARGVRGRSKVTVRATGQTVFDVPISSDSYGRRTTAGPRGKAREFLAVFGCSFVFGIGVGDDDTLPSQIARNAAAEEVLNYGVPGAGPIEALKILKRPNFDSGVPHLPGQAVFVVMSDHVRRVSPSVVNLSRVSLAYFEEGGRSGGVVMRDSFSKAHPFRALFYGALNGSQILKFFHLDYPMVVGDRQAVLIAELLKRMQYEWRAKYPGTKFTVVLYPGVGPLGLVLRRLFDSMNIPYLDYGEVSLDDAIGGPWTVSEYEGHPSARANAWLGKQIATDLGLVTRSNKSAAAR